MSSNLFKSYYLNRDMENARVIDSNEMVAQKLERLRMIMTDGSMDSDGFTAVNLFTQAGSVDPAELLDGNGYAEEDGDMVSSVIKAGEPVSEPEPVYTGPTPEELVARAQEEISIMRANAQRALEKERMQTLSGAQAAGYEEGKRIAMQELEMARQELEQERMQLQAEYERQIDELEPLFVRILTGIYEKVFEVGLDNQSEIVTTLLRNTMKKIDGCKNFLVHVSAADYPYVKEHKESLLSDSAQEGTVIDIVEDSMMRENECMIETINGIYDCGIGTQLKELRKKITLLSYDGQQES